MKHTLKECILNECHSYTYGGGRGLCKNHYRDSKKGVDNGVITWKVLEEAGLAKAPRI